MTAIATSQKSFPALLTGAYVSVQIAFFATIIGIVGGIGIALLQRSSSSLIRYLAHTYVWIFRGTPMVVQIMFMYYGLNLPFSPFVTAIIAIGLNSCAYISQIMRSGIEAVEKGQLEAAYTLGISWWDTTRYIILPQAIRTILPALGSEFITLIKDSSLAYIIGVNELFKEARTIMSVTFDVMTIYAGMTLLYLAMTSTVSYIMHRIEQRLKFPC